MAAAVFMILGGSAVLGGGTAKANRVDDYTVDHAREICAHLDAASTDAQVSHLLRRVIDDGFDVNAAATVLVNAVIVWCPQHVGALAHFADGTPHPAPSPAVTGVRAA